LGLLRIAILIGALAAAHVGISDALFHLRCPEPIDLRGAPALDEETRLWVSVEGRIADAPPLVLAAGTDDSMAACIPLLATGGGNDLEAMMLTMTVSGARALRSLGGKVRLEGIGRPASGGEAQRLAAYARSVGIELPEGLIVVEVGRRPPDLAGAASLAALGVLTGLLTAWRLALNAHHSRAGRCSGEEAAEAPYTLRDLVLLPLPEETREEVHSMVKEAWESSSERREVVP
jgi:hypothetical protein